MFLCERYNGYFGSLATGFKIPKLDGTLIYLILQRRGSD